MPANFVLYCGKLLSPCQQHVCMQHIQLGVWICGSWKPSLTGGQGFNLSPPSRHCSCKLSPLQHICMPQSVSCALACVHIIPAYYMATIGSMSGQDKSKPTLGLATRARWSYLARSGLPAVSRKKNVNKSQIITPLLTKFVRSRWLAWWYRPRSFFARLWTSTTSR